MRSIRRPNQTSRPSLGGSLVHLLVNFPVGIAGFVLIVTLGSVGVGTSIIWVGIPIVALLLLGTRGAANFERARTRVLLNTAIESPYQVLPNAGQKERWKARLHDGATWRDFAYFLVMLPIGIIHFTVVVCLWAPALGLIGLPIYFRYLPGGVYYLPSEPWHWATVNSTMEALPWAALGVLLVALAVPLTKKLGSMHANFARNLLGPTATETLPSAPAEQNTRELSTVSG